MAKWREMGYGDQRSPMLMELPKARGFNDPQYTRCIADGGGASILGSHEARAVVCDLTGLSRVRGRVDGHLVGVDCQIERSSSEGDAQCAATGLHDWKSPENGDRRVLQGPLVVYLIPLLSRAQASLTNAWAKTKNTTETRSVATESRTLSVASHCTSQLPEIREVRPPGKATRTLEKMFAAAWTGKKADRAAQTAPSAALAAAEHHAGAGALGVGTQHFRAAEDIGNSSARPPGEAQKKQLKSTPK